VKILNAEQIRAWDDYTIRNEPVSSIDLMERAAAACTGWLEKQHLLEYSFAIFCGKGNNGGDGLAIARMLAEKKCNVSVYILEFGQKGTNDFLTNLQRIHGLPIPIHYIQSALHFPVFKKNEIIIDALFGSGLNRPLEAVTAQLVEHINHAECPVIAIDIPSGLSADRSSKGHIAVKAQYTLTFQCIKPAFLVAENGAFIGSPVILDIGLDQHYYQSLVTADEMIDHLIIRSIYKPRNRFAHKGVFGHALLLAGSYGKMGAAVLAARACLRSGAGLLTCHIPSCGYAVLQTALPEAMVMTDFNSSFITKTEADLTRFTAIGIGPGMGTASETKMLLRELLDAFRGPLVLDADALNCLALQKDFLSLLPAGTILTPHPKEFDRLFGACENDFDRIAVAKQKAAEHQVIIVLKGHHTFIATPDKKGYFNNTGNPGMATGGSGDVLTGIITGLLAQQYSPVEAAILAVYLHGLAGDFAAKKYSEEAMLAGDIIEFLGDAFKNCREA
jgi:NAD(P)H-hydrate epimerase